MRTWNNLQSNGQALERIGGSPAVIEILHTLSRNRRTMLSLYLFNKDAIMFRPPFFLRRSDAPLAQRRGARPVLELLEPRLLLYSDLGDQWTYDSRITYSFMPDGTSVGGVPSVLFQTLNAKYATATWEGQIEEAASFWETSPT